MSGLPSHARVVIIGAGIVGNCVAYHLARLSWKDLVLIDKGPLPNPGGSTGHASNFIYPVDHSKIMTQITRDSLRQYQELGVFRESGGLELARTPENFQELHRRVASAKCWGESGEVVSPERVKSLMPFVNTRLIRGAFWVPTVGVVDSLRAGTLMRESAQQMGALTLSANTEVQGIVVTGGRVRAVRTSRGEIQTEYVVIACGIWSPRLARMAGAAIPLSPAVHQMISVGPIKAFEKTTGEIGYPIIRDMTTMMYERQNGGEMEIGSYAHRPILMEPDDIPSIETSKLSPTELPFTKEDFEPQMAQALELLPDLLDDENAGIQYAINGLLSLTPDGGPIAGETPEVKGLWSAAAVWIKEAPGVGRMVAEWMTTGEPELDPNEVDVARFQPYARTRRHVRARTSEIYNRTYGIVHPREQWTSSRNHRLSPFHSREKDLGAVFFELAGWERPHWYESNSRLLEHYGDRVQPRPNEWDARWWSPIINAEHLAMRDRVGMVDLSAFAIFDIRGPGVLEYIQKLTVGQMDVPPGKAVYTPLLNRAGGFKSDLTITRMTEHSYRIVTGGSQGGIDGRWFRDNLPADRSVELHDLTSALCTVGLWGPKARLVLQSVTQDDVSSEAFPYASAKQIDVGSVPVWALRISYVGELGWELYAPMEQGAELWDLLWTAGQEHGLLPVGIGVYATTARLEKGYRLYGHELDTEYNPVEADLARPNVKAQEFIGKEAYLKARAEAPAAILCTLVVENNVSSSGERRYMLGHEPILTTAGEPITDHKGRRSYVTSAGSGPSLGKYLLMAYLPPEYARVGTQLKVEYFGEHYPVTVAVAGSTPLFDSTNERMKG
ncbi:MAG: FAD-dependent oxidoreductase [Gemmatimonadetes bacterium]|nr:FAD-dependent oxidoreductase [Gemmatimonadota bacterium]